MFGLWCPMISSQAALLHPFGMQPGWTPKASDNSGQDEILALEYAPHIQPQRGCAIFMHGPV